MISWLNSIGISSGTSKPLVSTNLSTTPFFAVIIELNQITHNQIFGILVQDEKFLFEIIMAPSGHDYSSNTIPISRYNETLSTYQIHILFWTRIKSIYLSGNCVAIWTRITNFRTKCPSLPDWILNCPKLVRNIQYLINGSRSSILE